MSDPTPHPDDHQAAGRAYAATILGPLVAERDALREEVEQLRAEVLEAEARGVEWAAEQATGYTSHLFQQALRKRAAELHGGSRDR